MKTAPEVLTTARMRGERPVPEHQAAMELIFADPRVGATMGGAWTPEQVTEQLALAAKGWEREGFGYWMFFDAATGAPAARGGLSRTEFDGRPEVEVAFTLPHNLASRRVMEKLGFAYEKSAPYKVFGEHVLYRRRP